MTTIEKEAGLACLWAGDLSFSELEAYIGIQHDAEGTPFIPFGEDLGTAADHDYLSITATEAPTRLVDLLARMHWDDDALFYEAVARDCNPANLYRCALVYSHVAPTPDMYRRRFADGRMCFLGCWPIDQR